MNFNQCHKERARIARNIFQSYRILEEDDNVHFRKGGKPAVFGEKRIFGGREYIKTSDGWKYHGKGTGAKAQEHAKHNVKEEAKQIRTEASQKQVKLIERIKNGDGEYLVRNDKGEEIGKMYRDTSTGWWRELDYESKGAWDVSGDYLGDTKSEAYHNLLENYNKRTK